MIIEREIEGEEYVKCETFDDFEEWCNEGGWDGEDGFFQETRLSFADVEGKFFTVVHSRVFIYEEEKLWIEEYKDGI